MDELNLDLLMSFVEQHFHLTGEFLSQEKALEDYGIPAGHYKQLLENPACRTALEEKGVIFERFENKDWTAKSLTPLQLLTANTMLDVIDTRSQKKKLQDLGVHTQTYQAWLKDPVFKEYLGNRAAAMLGDNAHEADLALLDRIRSGDMKAISMWYEMTGKFVPQRANAANVDIQNVLIKVIEIITEEVTDPQDAIRISNRLRSLAMARNVAGALTGSEDEPIEVPEVVPVRELES